MRRLEEQLVASKVTTKSRGAPLVPPQRVQQGLNVHLVGGAALRAVERAEYDQLLRESEQEKAEMRREVERYKKKLVTMHKTAWEAAESTASSRRDAVVPELRGRNTPAPTWTAAATHVGEAPAGKTLALEHALQREDAARKEWLRAAKPFVRFEGASGSKGLAMDGGTPGTSTGIPQVSARAHASEDSDDDHSDAEKRLQQLGDGERDKMIAALKHELLQTNTRVAQLQVDFLTSRVARQTRGSCSWG